MLGSVAAGASKTTFCACAKEVMAAVAPDVREPIITFTLSFVTNFLYALTVFSGLPSSSSEISTTCLPAIPPAAFISAMASSIPLRASIPYTATGPERGKIPPIANVSAFFAPQKNKNAARHSSAPAAAFNFVFIINLHNLRDLHEHTIGITVYK